MKPRLRVNPMLNTTKKPMRAPIEIQYQYSCGYCPRDTNVATPTVVVGSAGFGCTHKPIHLVMHHICQMHQHVVLELMPVSVLVFLSSCGDLN